MGVLCWRPEPGLGQSNSPFIVEVENAWKIYQTGSVKVEALRGINLGVKKGEMVAVMGPSGCGKTTLLNCVSGLDDLSKGKVTIESVDLAKMSDDQKSEFRAKRMGFIFQAYNLLPVLTAQENIELPLLLGGVPEADAHVAAMDALKMVGLTEWRAHKPMELSGGQQQRVTIARALVNKPAIVWADEPTGNLDSENSQEIIRLLRSLNQQYALTVVLVSHDPTIAQQTDRIVHMRNGLIE
ncbi:ABC transporter ATP-binding protein, partial [Candidatus Bathyarchaeota archaeon]|nr:ABC transporter ATP-binding protein [Candidatus Bathyarchaeota archaeon]